MATPRRKCRLADIKHADVDLRNYSKVIIETIEQVIPGKNPKVFKECFSTYILLSQNDWGWHLFLRCFFIFISPRKICGESGNFVSLQLFCCRLSWRLSLLFFPNVFPLAGCFPETFVIFPVREGKW